jgi:hypothetical protein
VDLTAIEGIDEIHALTLVSELGCDLGKWATVKHFTCLAGAVSQLAKDGRQGENPAGCGAAKTGGPWRCAWLPGA